MTIFGLAKPTMFGSDGQAKPGFPHFSDALAVSIHKFVVRMMEKPKESIRLKDLKLPSHFLNGYRV